MLIAFSNFREKLYTTLDSHWLQEILKRMVLFCKAAVEVLCQTIRSFNNG